MKAQRIVGAMGSITRLYSAAFLLPAIIALAYDSYDLHAFGISLPRGFAIFMGCGGFTFILGTVMRTLGGEAQELREKEAYLTVGVGWLLLAILSMLPFMLQGTLTHPIDAFFETMSGMTTTGATVISGELELVAPGLMMWRAFLQFIGGMGIIVLSVALLAKLTQGSAHLLQAEAPGPSMTRIAPRLAHTARILWTVYLSLAAVCFVALFLIMLRHDMGLKQTFYDALLHAFTTIATGGFSNHTLSIAYYDDWVLEAAIIFFILVSGTNYTLHFFFFSGHGLRILKDPEWRFFFGSVIAIMLFTTGLVWQAGGSLLDALRGSTFTVAALVTSTGYATVDYDLWPGAAKLALFYVMAVGATAGSTSGGMKQVRVLLLAKLVVQQFRRINHPHAVIPIRLGERVVKPEILITLAAFFMAYVTLWGLGTVALLTFDSSFSNLLDASGASISALSNMGPAFGVVGPTKNYAALADSSKVILTFLMWFGRLEIFAALMVFLPATWKNR